jgi:hypothetical protein
MSKTRTQIQITINVDFTCFSNVESFVKKMDSIQAIIPSYKWEMSYIEGCRHVTFKVTTYEEYMAITSKSGQMGGSVSSEIDMEPIYKSIENDIERVKAARGKAKERSEKKDKTTKDKAKEKDEVVLGDAA